MGSSDGSDRLLEGSYADPKGRVAALLRELGESLAQQAATSEILRVIRTSPTDAQPVFETIVRSAVSLCRSLFANVFRFDGELLHFVASHNVGPDYVDLLRKKYPMRPDTSQVSGRVLLTKLIVRLEDVLTDPDYDQRFPQAMGWRRMLGVPMLREGKPVGVVVVGWADPGPVPSTQEQLLKTFADQAVIAIENARLFNEIQEKTRQLEIAGKYKSHFLVSASHDLRQPLHALNLFVAQLKTEQDPAERARLVARIDAAVGSMNELFGSLLDMAKLEAGITEPDFAEFPIARARSHRNDLRRGGAQEGLAAQGGGEQRVGAERYHPVGAHPLEPRVERGALYGGGRDSGRLPPAQR
jgi:GAF domain-containing protein